MLLNPYRFSPAGGIAAPTVANVVGTSITTASTTHVVNVNAAAGQRSIVFGVASALSASAFTLPAGWTQLIRSNPTGTTMLVGYRDYVAGDPSTITVTSSSTVRTQWHSVNIEGGTFDAAAAPLLLQSVQNTAAPTFQTVTDPTGGRPKLAIAWIGTDGAATLVAHSSNMSGLASAYASTHCSSHLASAPVDASINSFTPAAAAISAAQVLMAASLFVYGSAP